MINARAETVREKPSFRTAFKHRRCLVVTEGFFEWRKSENYKQAFHIHRSGYGIFAFAGLWEHHQLEQNSLYSCTVVTTAASKFMLPIHDRMPVIIPKDHYTDWLDKADDGSHAYSLLDNQELQRNVDDTS